MVECDGPFFARFTVTDGEITGCPKADAGDTDRVNFRFAVAVPSHGISAVPVQVEEARIERWRRIAHVLNGVTQLKYLRREGSFRPANAGIAILRPHPSGQPRLEMFLSIHCDGVLLPRNVLAPTIERFSCKCTANHPTSRGAFPQDEFAIHGHIEATAATAPPIQPM